MSEKQENLKSEMLVLENETEEVSPKLEKIMKITLEFYKHKLYKVNPCNEQATLPSMIDFVKMMHRINNTPVDELKDLF